MNRSVDQISTATLGSHPPLLSATFRSIGALMLREMATRYGRNPGGYLWAVLEPAAGIAFLCLVFQAGFRAPPLGTSFALFYATGILPFFAFLTVSNAVAQALNRSLPLLGYPRVSLLDPLISAACLAALTQLIVGVIILGALVISLAPMTRIDILPLGMSYVLAMSFGLATGVALAVPVTAHPMWQSIWSVLTRPLVIVSGVILLHEKLPDPWRSWLEWNPLVHATGLARQAAYPGYSAAYVNPGYVLAVSGCLCLFGLVLLRLMQRDLFER